MSLDCVAPHDEYRLRRAGPKSLAPDAVVWRIAFAIWPMIPIKRQDAVEAFDAAIRQSEARAQQQFQKAVRDRHRSADTLEYGAGATTAVRRQAARRVSGGGGRDDDGLKSALAKQPPTIASMTALLMLAALLVIFAAPASAVAQAPPTIDPEVQWGLVLIHAPDAWLMGYTGAGITVSVGDSGLTNNQPLKPPGTGAFNDIINYRLKEKFRAALTGCAIRARPNRGPRKSRNACVRDHWGVEVQLCDRDRLHATIVMLRTVLPDDTCEGEKLKCLPDLPQDAIEYFATLQGVQIYNASYGPTVPSGVYNLQKWSVTADNSSDESQALKALSKGKIIVAAAGNHRDTNPVAGKNPSGLGLYPFIRPGVNANAGVYDDGGKKFDFSSLLKQPGLIIAVTSVDKNKKIVPYAQTCGVTASWCVAAPGGTSAAGIYSTNSQTATSRCMAPRWRRQWCPARLQC